MQMLVQPLSHRRRRAYNIRDRCLELSEFREEATAPTAMQSRIPVQLILGPSRSTILSMEYNRALLAGVTTKGDSSVERSLISLEADRVIQWSRLEYVRNEDVIVRWAMDVVKREPATIGKTQIMLNASSRSSQSDLNYELIGHSRVLRSFDIHRQSSRFSSRVADNSVTSHR